jgi:dihydropyrimidine dehydrogenase (NADP+)
VELLE